MLIFYKQLLQLVLVANSTSPSNAPVLFQNRGEQLLKPVTRLTSQSLCTVSLKRETLQRLIVAADTLITDVAETNNLKSPSVKKVAAEMVGV
jgi:hypothetical protein